MEKYLNKNTPDAEHTRVHMSRANVIVKDKGLDNFLEGQLGYRKWLGIAPMTH